MSLETSLVPERALARHDPVLVRSGPAASEVLAALARANERLARGLRGAIAPLLGGKVPSVEIATTPDVSADELQRADLCAYSLYAAGPAGTPVATVIEGATVLRLVDRAFGGPGEEPSSIPRELPLSGELMVQRIEAILATQLAAALGPGAGPLRPLRRDSSLAQLRPFAPGTRLALVTITVREAGRMAWDIVLALPAAALAALTGVDERSARAAARARKTADPLSEPYAALPLEVSAVLVDVPMPLSVISRLEVGQVLAVPVARAVPLRIGDRTVAHGSVGALDDRVAIQITQLA